MTDGDGVTKFVATFHHAPPPAPALLTELIHWRQQLISLSVLGQDPARYDGVGFGNVSCRHPGRPNAFIITGTQTGGMATLSPRDFAVVTAWDWAANTLTAEGGRPPSSEALTHAALYSAAPGICWVLHGHAPALWHSAERHGIPTTPANVAFGTPEMAAGVAALVANRDGRGLGLPGLLAMGGHEDGVIAYGATAASTGELMVRWTTNLTL